MKSDRRIIKTRKAIINALTELLEEKNFNNITIKDLTEKADINRGTFYLHYEDKFDMLKSIEEDIFSEFGNIFQKHVQNGDVDRLFLNDSNPIIMDILEYVEENHGIFKAILGPNGDSNFSRKLRDFIGKLISREELFKNIADRSKIPVEYITAYFSAADLGIIQYWLENDMNISKEQLALLLTKMLTTGYLTLSKVVKDK